jgi:ribosomal-protein-serine acetyltransferase
MHKESTPDPSDNLSGRSTFIEPVADAVSEELLAALVESRAELSRTMSWDCWDRNAVRGFLERSAREREADTGYNFAIRERGSGALTGVIGLKGFDPFTPKAEVGYWIRSSMTGRGYATDALAIVLGFCREDLKLVRVDACAADFNVASHKVLLKCGFEKEGSKRHAQLCHGRWLDMVLFGKVFG